MKTINNLPKVDDIFKRTYYWVATSSNGGSYLAVEQTKAKIIIKLRQLEKDGLIDRNGKF